MHIQVERIDISDQLHRGQQPSLVFDNVMPNPDQHVTMATGKPVSDLTWYVRQTHVSDPESTNDWMKVSKGSSKVLVNFKSYEVKGKDLNTILKFGLQVGVMVLGKLEQIIARKVDRLMLFHSDVYQSTQDERQCTVWIGIAAQTYD